MTELAVVEPDEGRAVVSQRRTVDLMRFAEEASRVRRIAQVLAQTNFVPAVYHGRPDEVTAVILFGRELGIDPMNALQVINVIKGRPTISANGMRGLAESVGVVFQVPHASDEKVVMRARAPHHETWTVSEWTVARARRMGLVDKENWQKQPQAMLTARCTSELCRLVAADVLIGMPYSAEELSDFDDQNRTVASAPAKSRTVRRKTPVYAGTEEFTPDSDPFEGGVPFEATPAPIQPGTRKTLMALFGDAAITDRATRLKVISGAIDREVKSANDLTEDEAHQVILALQEENRQAQVGAAAVEEADGEWPAVVEATP